MNDTPDNQAEVVSANPSLRPLRVAWVDDGKAGHRSQVLGLIEALGQYRAVEVHSLKPLGFWRALGCWALKRCRPALPEPPQLVLGAGHRTHLSLLALQRAWAIPAVVLMRPSLPLGWFARAIVPKHDSGRAGERVLLTDGVLNRLRPGVEHDSSQGLILLGGPSKHYHWDDALISTQIEALLSQRGITWRIADSRRTPATTTAQLRTWQGQGITYLPWERTPSPQLIDLMYRAGEIWVTPDSVSMVFEALTSGARVGLLRLVPRKRNRVVKGVERLLAEGRVVLLDESQLPAQWPVTATPLDEADRAAQWLLDSLPDL